MLNLHVMVRISIQILHTSTLQCVRSLLFLSLTFNDSYYHIRIEVCENSLLCKIPCSLYFTCMSMVVNTFQKLSEGSVILWPEVLLAGHTAITGSLQDEVDNIVCLI